MFPEPLVSTADQTKRGLWGREWYSEYFGSTSDMFGSTLETFRSLQKPLVVVGKKKIKKKTSGEAKVIGTPAEYNLEVIVLLFPHQ